MALEKLTELIGSVVGSETPREPQAPEPPAEPTKVDDQPPPQEPQPGNVAASIKDLTGGKYEKVEDLYGEYTKLSQQLQEQKPAEYTFKDDWIKGVVQRYEKGEDLTPYLKAKTTNVDSMSAEELLRLDLKEQYPNASAKQLDSLYKKHVVAKFNLDPDENDEDEISIGRVEMERAANEIRNKYKDSLKPFLQPEPIEQPKSEMQKPEVDQQKLEEEAMAKFREFEETIRNNPATKSMLEKKTFEIPTVDGEKFNLEIEAPDELLDQAIYSEKFYQNFAGEEGPDLNKFFMVSQFAKDPTKFIELLVGHGKELGKAQVLQEIENPSEPERRSPGKEKSPWEILFEGAAKK